MRKMNGIIRWMASHHFTVNFLHFARHAPKGRVMTNVAARVAVSNAGLWLEKSIREYVAEGRGMVKEGGANTTGHGDHPSHKATGGKHGDAETGRKGGHIDVVTLRQAQDRLSNLAKVQDLKPETRFL